VSTTSTGRDALGVSNVADVEGAGALLADQRRAIHQRLLDGASGAEIIGAFSELVDGLIIGRYRNAVRQGDEKIAVAGSQHCCLVALGGYGRRELAPYSDIDLMFLFETEAGEAATGLSREVLHHLWDLGFQVGHSIRTIRDCLELAPTDLAIKTSLIEARYLAGSADLFQQFQRRYLGRIVTRGIENFLEKKMDERRREYEKFGETIYLLEPNVKKSKGGLRDLHVLQWVGMVKYQAPTIQDLTDRGILSRHDYAALVDAREFLWRVRALLHVHAGMAQEILSFDEQVWLAQVLGFEDRPHLLAVEQFMQQYYRHTMGLHEISVRFIDRCRGVSLWDRMAKLWPSPKVDGYFLVTGHDVTVPVELRPRVLGNPELLLRLFELAGAQRLKIDMTLLEDIHRHLDTLSDEAFRRPEVSRIFLRLLSGPGAIAPALEAMHRAHLLEKIIPVFATVRGLMQFNQYHKYTVDEHSLLAVAKCEGLAQEQSILGAVYREIRRKDLLHLAILLHDLGKGREEDHSEVGKAIAEETAGRLGFDDQETRTLVFLVHRHLLMAHTAFRRDPYDDKVMLGFAREVGTPEVLRKMIALTAADIAAVGPGVLTKWKESLLVELYLRTLPEVSGEREQGGGIQQVAQVAHDLAQDRMLTALAVEPEWIESQLTLFPLRYLLGTPPSRIAVHLAALRMLQPGQVRVVSHFNDTLGASEYTVVTFHDLTPGIFSKIAGVMAAKGLQILDAQIMTRPDGIVVDTFHVTDPDYRGAPPADRPTSIAETIEHVLKNAETVEHLVARSGRLTSLRRLPANRQPTEVRIDNETSDGYTIIDVFADDRQGLLYVMTHAMFQLGLSVHASRISTRLDQVADVFYVTDQMGGKIEDPARLEAIRIRIADEVDRCLKIQPEV
jgi:[protein-PII] uridylyltransferase